MKTCDSNISGDKADYQDVFSVRQGQTNMRREKSSENVIVSVEIPCKGQDKNHSEEGPTRTRIRRGERLVHRSKNVASWKG